jgi:nucleoside permease NupC
MQRMVAAGELSERAKMIATYALCGFANFSSIAIQIGGIGGIAPERKADLARLGLRAMVAGSLACFQTATIAGILLLDQDSGEARDDDGGGGEDGDGREGGDLLPFRPR